MATDEVTVREDDHERLEEGRRILRRLEEDSWRTASDLSSASTVETVRDRECGRRVRHRLRVSESRETVSLTESEAEAHDFSKYRTDPSSRETHAPTGFVTGAIEYLTGEPEWQTCGGCGGSGRIECNVCNGTGSKRCTSCRAGNARCSACTGTGIYEKEVGCRNCAGRGVVGSDPNHSVCAECGGNGKQRRDVTCKYCDGDGEVECENCEGDNEVTCRDCDGDGDVTCGTCDGSGRLLRFELLERAYEHEREITVHDCEIPEELLTGVEGTKEDTRSPTPAEADVLRHRVEDYGISGTQVRYEYDGEHFDAYEIEETAVEATEYPKSRMRRLTPLVGVGFVALTIAAVVVVLLP